MQPALFTPFSVKNITLKNRIVMSPMCMYSCFNQDGKVIDWHMYHYISRAMGQTGLIFTEAAAVTPQGRISHEDLGIWDDSHIDGLKKLTKAVKENDSHIGVQLAHAGRKATVDGPIIAPSSLAFNDEMKTPEEMSTFQISDTIQAFKAAAKRAAEAGFDVLEIHAAHGYLINEFLSPLTNQRGDEYGGSLQNRYRFLQNIIKEIRSIWHGPLFVRISANEYEENGNKLEDFIQLASWMKQDGADLVDCSSGGVTPTRPHTFPGFQIPNAEAIKKETGLDAGAVGLITSGIQAEEILQNDRADLVFIGRDLLRNPYWPLKAANELNYSLAGPKQYERGWKN
ncbi:NADPH dehydrogenase NamA [Alteribacillus sp. JSM 102045]|uniref:NADPH dehydrogenase NamA n=1 Tax=Alteribacillus sp. JSM 102045 TaxID=1562101 RepID=UPI0035BF3666